MKKSREKRPQKENCEIRSVNFDVRALMLQMESQIAILLATNTQSVKKRNVMPSGSLERRKFFRIILWVPKRFAATSLHGVCLTRISANLSTTSLLFAISKKSAKQMRLHWNYLLLSLILWKQSIHWVYQPFVLKRNGQHQMLSTWDYFCLCLVWLLKNKSKERNFSWKMKLG